MTYEEFKREIDALGFVFEDYVGSVWVEDRERRILAKVDKHYLLCVNMSYVPYLQLNPDVRRNLFDLCVELAKTPLEERELVKKYYLIHKLIRKRNFNNAYLHLALNDGSFLTGNESAYINAFVKVYTKVQFTLDEIEEIKEKHKVTLEDWELVEVGE